MQTFASISIFLGIVLLTSFSNAFTRNDFPEDFVFGAATSAYQWEGAVNEDGKSLSVWDTFSHSHNRGNGDIACDGYHKYKEDVKLMAEMGLNAFRFSISWSRLIPNGRGFINPKGVRFYKNLIKELLNNGIEPHVTLFHFDLPQCLENEYGGWINREIIEDFTAYADVCFREFGDDVKFWTTINEANILSLSAYSDGIAPPGHCTSTKFLYCSTGNSSIEPYLASHHMLLAHASTSRLYKLKYKNKQRGAVSLSLYVFEFVPYTSLEEDEVATQRARDFLTNWMLRPLIFGDYPNEMKRILGSRLPNFSKEESEQVKGSSDFIGINHYMTVYIRYPRHKSSLHNRHDFLTDMNTDMFPMKNFTTLEFGAIPWGLESILKYIKQSYNNPPIYILENGKPMKRPSTLWDTQRINYIQAYMGAVLNSIRNGSNIRGYFVWSIIDLYELLTGYKYSFGLYYVNFSDPKLTRSPKLSAYWYSAFLKDTIDVTHSRSSSW